MRYDLLSEVEDHPDQVEVHHVAAREYASLASVCSVELKVEYFKGGVSLGPSLAPEIQRHQAMALGATEAQWLQLAEMAEGHELNDIGELLTTTNWGREILWCVWRGSHAL